MLHIWKEIKLGVYIYIYIYRGKVGGVGNGAISFLYFFKEFFPKFLG